MSIYVLTADETNREETDHARFFIMGGTIVAEDRLAALHDTVERIRRDAGLNPQDQFKFTSNARPDHVPPDVWTQAKNELLEACIELEVQFIACVIHHRIARAKDDETRTAYGLNEVLDKFNDFVAISEGRGLCLIDQLSGDRQERRHLKEKFQAGCHYPNGKTKRLKRILGYGLTFDGASHLSSVNDIIFDAFRYVANKREPNEVTKRLAQLVGSLVWGVERNGQKAVRDRGLILRPMEPYAYKPEYDELLDRLASQVNATE